MSRDPVARAGGRTRRARAALLLLASLLAPACGDEPAPEPPLGRRLEQLRALGYVEASERIADPAESGARILDPEAVSPGYSLYAAPFDCAAYLIDLEGHRVHAWRDDLSHDGETRACTKWGQADLLPDGDLLVPVSAEPAPGEEFGAHLLRMSWDGEVRWRASMRAHHDAEQAPSGEIVALEQRFRRDHPWEEEALLIDNAVQVRSPEGTLLRRVSLYDVLRDNAVGFALQPIPPFEGRRYIDLLHANSIETLRDTQLADRHPLYRPGNWLVSLRHQDAVIVVDPEARELVWFWGPGELSGQHDAQMLENGNVLIFDNGLDRGRSRVVELDPVAGEIVWQYGTGDDPHFFTAGRGASQKLPNGNVLVVNSNEGEAFEVTRDHRVVWRFHHPEIDDEGRREVIVRMVRYPPERIEPLLARDPGAAAAPASSAPR